jgi:hypothetical protein
VGEFFSEPPERKGKMSGTESMSNRDRESGNNLRKIFSADFTPKMRTRKRKSIRDIRQKRLG